jgi:imidazolonepropionase
LRPDRALFVRARAIVPCVTYDSDATQGGVTFEELGLIEGGAILTEGNRIAAIGPEDEIASNVPRACIEVDARDCVIVPGFVDAHSHPLFAGDREADFAARTRGKKAQQGMIHTVLETRKALQDPEHFFRRMVRPRLHAMLEHGTTTLETKTGYALTKDGELALLDLIAAHRSDPGIPRLLSTFLGAHALPPEFESTGEYTDFLIADVLPEARARGAVYADAFCEPGFFTVEESRRYLGAAKRHGLRARLHCDEMSAGGAALMATQLGVDAVDHCNFIEAAVADAIARTTVLVSCPATIEFLGLETHAPVRQILDLGGTVALASDFNPGTSPCFNLQTVAYFGRKFFGLTAAETLYAATRAPAKSLRCDAGVLRAEGAADLVALQIEDAREFGWQFGGNLAKFVIKGGAVV